MTSRATYDSRKYECCAPYYGEIGEEFTRRFKPEFEGALHTYVDNFASLYDHVVLRNDPGSIANPTNNQQTRAAFAQRQKKSYGLIWRHVEDPTLRDEIDLNAMGDGPAAWEIIVDLCQRPQTFLNLSTQEKEWQNTSITEVGFSERTVEAYRALLLRINKERPAAQQKSNIDIWQKLLEGIGTCGPPELKMRVRDELQRPTMLHPPGHAQHPGEPDVSMYTQHFAERWRSLLADGSIKPMPPRSKATPSGNRVDALSAQICEEEEVDEVLTAFKGIASTPSGASTERICFNCKGVGHIIKDQSGRVICPSPIQQRTLSYCIGLLEAERQRGRRNPARRQMVMHKPLGTKKPSARIAEADVPICERDDEASFDVTVDGENVYDMSGSLVGCLAAPTTALPDQDTNVAHASVVTPISDAQPPNIDTDFANGFFPQTASSLLAVGSASDDPPTLTCPTASRTRRTSLLVSATLVFVTAALITARRVGRPALFLTCLGFGSTFHIARARSSTPMVHASAFVSKHSASDYSVRNAAAIDSGATMHVSGRKELFPAHLITDRCPRIRVQIADETSCAAQFQGTMCIPVLYRPTVAHSTPLPGMLHLRNALYVPQLKTNTLVSPKALFHDQSIRTYLNDDLHLRLPSGAVLDITEANTLYLLPIASHSSAKVLKVVPLSADDVHSRCMHFSLDRIAKSAPVLDNLPPRDVLRHDLPCDACTRAVSTKHSARPMLSPKYSIPGQCVCSDTCDMGEYSTPFGFRYFLSFLDMATRYLWVYFLRTHQHSEVRAAYLQFLADASPYFPGGRVLLWYMDNGSEFNVAAGVGKDKPGFFSNNTDTWLAEYFTRRKFIVPWNPAQNPAESVNRILLRPARTALHAASIPTRYWPFAIHQAAIVHNALSTSSLTAVHAHVAIPSKMVTTILEKWIKPQNLSPHKMLKKTNFNFDHLHTLFCACDCVIRNPSDLQALPKAAPRTTPVVHLGLDLRRAGYFVYLLKYQRFTTSAIKDTYFGNERSFPDLSLMTGEIRQKDSAAKLPSEEQQIQSRDDLEVADTNIPTVPTDREHRPSEIPDLPSSRTRSRTRSIDAMICKDIALPPGFVTVCTDNGLSLAMKADMWRPMSTPSSTQEALAQDRDGWLEAYRKDLEAKMQNGAFIYRDWKPGMTIHKTKWAHKLEWNDDNTLKEMRARLVGCGYSQVPGRDFIANYSGTPSSAAIRIFEAAIAYHDLDEEHCDIVKAFTQSKLDVTLFVSQPPGLPPVLDRNGKPQVMEVVMGLEGFRQSGNIHQREHTATLTDNTVAKFDFCNSEPCLFAHIDGEIVIYALVWTDDVRFAYSRKAAPRYEKFLSDVYGKRWNFKRKGPIKRFVGVDITRDRDSKSITLSLDKYIEGIWKKFVPAGHIPRNTPYKSAQVVNDISTAKDSVDRSKVSEKPYLAAVASCIWAFTMIRADISFVLNSLCAVMHDPSMHAWEQVLIDLISYLHQTRSISITYKRSSIEFGLPPELIPHKDHVLKQCGLYCWVDASWKQPSVAGHVIMLLGAPVLWSTKLIKVVCHSSAEAEVSSGCLLAKAYMYARPVCQFLQLPITGSSLVLIDSQAAMAIGSNLGTTKRSAHYLRWQHYLRWCKLHGYLDFVFIAGSRQLADALTKPVDITAFRTFRKCLFGY